MGPARVSKIEVDGGEGDSAELAGARSGTSDIGVTSGTSGNCRADIGVGGGEAGAGVMQSVKTGGKGGESKRVKQIVGTTWVERTMKERELR